MTAQYLYRLDEIHHHLQNQVGNKAFYLGLLAQAGYPVVPGIVVSSAMFRDFWQQIRWNAPLFADFPNSSLHVDVDNSQQLQTIAQQLQAAIHTTPLPDEWQQSLATAVEVLDADVLIFRPSIALSGALNPSLDGRIRGLLPTHTCRPNPEAIAQTLKQTWTGLFRAQSLFYWQRLGIPLQQILLSVLVQPVYAAESSGRLIPLSDDQVDIEAIWGIGKALTTGEAIPDCYRVDVKSQTVRHHDLGQQFTVYRVMAGSDAASDPAHAALTWQPSEWEGLSASAVDSMEPRVGLAGSSAHEQAPATPTRPRLLSGAVLKQLVWLSQAVNGHLRLRAELEWVVVVSGHSESKSHPDAAATVYLTQVLPDVGLSGPKNLAAQPQTNPSASLDSASWIGLGAAPGQITARAWVFTPELLAQGVEAIAPLPPGYVLVAPDVMPDWLNLIRQSAGIISERGGMTCHAAVVARELGIPAVVGVPAITHQIRTGDVLVIDGDRGTLRVLDESSQPEWQSQPERPLHNLDSLSNTTQQPTRSNHSSSSSSSAHVDAADEPQTEPDAQLNSHDLSHFKLTSTASASLEPMPPAVWQRLLSQLTASDRPNATQLMVSVSQPEALHRLANQPIDGIGLLRAELAILPLLDSKIPHWWIEQGHSDLLCQRITDHIRQFAEAVYPRPIYYRSLDMRSRDFGSLFDTAANATAHDLLGIHGTWSYQLDGAMFEVELAALRQIQLAGLDNIRLLLPFVRTVEEFSHCRRSVVNAGLYDSANFQLWIMAEVPSVIFLLHDYAAAGIDGIAIGTNDLTQLLLAIDRDHPQMQSSFDQRHPAVQRAIQQLIQTAQTLGLPCSVCGQAPVQHPELVASLVKWGVTAICVAPGAIASTYRAIARAERSILLSALRQGDRPSAS